MLRLSLVVALLSLGTSVLAHAGNLVTNGSFETGDFSGWTLSGDTSLTGVCDVTTCPGNFAPEDGKYAAYFGPVGDTATLSQMIATTPGDIYTLSFYLADPQGEPRISFLSHSGPPHLLSTTSELRSVGSNLC